MSVADYLAGGSGFGFEHPETVERLRAGMILDRYADQMIGEDWTNPDVIEITDASVSSVGQSRADGTQRRLVECTAVLTIADPTADVRIGDRVRRGAQLWEVVEFPETDVNPFTGWRPTLVVGMKEVHG